MSFLDVTFPRQTATELEAEDIDVTEIVAVQSGHESRNRAQRVMRRRYDMAAIGRTKAEALRIYDFFQVVGGRERSFRFYDYRHNSVTAGSIGTGDGVETDFQMRSSYTFGGQTVYRDETKIRGTPLVYVNGILQTVTTHYTVTLSTGVVAFVSPPADGAAITATFEFDVCCRFEQDRLRWKAINGGSDRLIFLFDQLSVIEVIGE